MSLQPCQQSSSNRYPWKHGKTDTPMYGIWQQMLNRCRNPSVKGYKNYGGRGIKVCDRWLTFQNFLADMGERPEGLTLERKDSNGDYEPSNCVWASRLQQSRNRRSLVMISHEGETLCAAEWAARLGIRSGTLRSRLRAGWSYADAVTTPLGPTSRRTGAKS